VITLAPTVTLWDAGELITAAKVLGVPHQPGTPLFVMLGHVWADLVGIGQYAWRLNLMSACFAAGAGCLFLVAERLLAGEERLLRIVAPPPPRSCLRLSSPGGRTATRPRLHRRDVQCRGNFLAGGPLARRTRYRAGAALAPAHRLHRRTLDRNHLLALLAGPAVSLFHLLYAADGSITIPSSGAASGRRAVLSALWIVLIAVGLGKHAAAGRQRGATARRGGRVHGVRVARFPGRCDRDRRRRHLHHAFRYPFRSPAGARRIRIPRRGETCWR
jgi:hypothetical protein